MPTQSEINARITERTAILQSAETSTTIDGTTMAVDLESIRQERDDLRARSTVWVTLLGALKSKECATAWPLLDKLCPIQLDPCRRFVENALVPCQKLKCLMTNWGNNRGLSGKKNCLFVNLIGTRRRAAAWHCLRVSD